ncbi:MAG: metal-sensitive transcriptional regulator [Leptospirillum sp.]
MKKHISSLDIAKHPKPIAGQISNRASLIEGEASCLNISRRMGAMGRTLVKKIMVHEKIDHRFETPSDRSSPNSLTSVDTFKYIGRC